MLTVAVMLRWHFRTGISRRDRGRAYKVRKVIELGTDRTRNPQEIAALAVRQLAP